MKGNVNMPMGPPPVPQQAYRGSSFAHPRPRSISNGPQFPYLRPGNQPMYVELNTMDQFTRLPPPVAVPHHLNVAPSKRNPPPTGPKPQPYVARLGEIENATDFKHAVINDPQGMFTQLTELLQRNRELQQDVTSIAQDYAHARRDYASKREQYDTLCAIGNAKQMLLWKFVERLQAGKFEGGGLQGAEERFEARQSDAGGSVKSSKKEQSACESPSKESQGNASPGTITSFLSGASDRDVFSSPERSVAESAAVYLDPRVEAFIPRGSSPVKYHEECSDAPGKPDGAAPGKPDGAAPVQLTDQEIKIYYECLPNHFQGICPISLTHEYSCNQVNCHMARLCEGYNSQYGSQGCTDPCCSNLHILRTCHDEVLGHKCKVTTYGDRSVGRKPHLVKRVHKLAADSEEWRAREFIAALIPAHQDGRYV